jgi:hypothetical protein
MVQASVVCARDRFPIPFAPDNRLNRKCLEISGETGKSYDPYRSPSDLSKGTGFSCGCPATAVRLGGLTRTNL